MDMSDPFWVSLVAVSEKAAHYGELLAALSAVFGLAGATIAYIKRMKRAS